MSCESLDVHDASKSSREMFKFLCLFVCRYSMNPQDKKKKKKKKTKTERKEE